MNWSCKFCETSNASADSICAVCDALNLNSASSENIFKKSRQNLKPFFLISLLVSLIICLFVFRNSFVRPFCKDVHTYYVNASELNVRSTFDVNLTNILFTISRGEKICRISSSQKRLDSLGKVSDWAIFETLSGNGWVNMCFLRDVNGILVCQQ